MRRLYPAGTDVRRRRSRCAAVAAGAVAFMVALAGCTGPGSGSEPDGSASDLTVGVSREWVSLDTKRTQNDDQLTFIWSVREGITGLTPELEVTNLLAEETEQTDSTTLRVTLKPGVTFSDGTPVTAEDVKAAMESYAASPEWGFKNQFPEIPTVTVTDDLTLELKTSVPSPNLARLMANITVIPADLNQPADVEDAPGTGPYMVESFNKGTQTVTLTKNEEFRDGVPDGPDQVIARYYADENARLAALRAGEIDVATSLSPDAAAQLEGVDGIVVERSPGTRLSHLAYNFRNPSDPRILDPRVREALSHAIDGDAIISGLLLDSVSPLAGVVPQTLQGAANVGSFDYDPDLAREMLADAGASDLKVRIIYETGEFFSISQVMEAIVDMLAEVGVEAELVEFAPGGDIGAWRRGEGESWDILGNGLGNQTGSALDTLLTWAGTDEKEQQRQTYHGFIVPEVTDAILAAATETDDVRRQELLADAQSLLYQEWPAMWGFVQNNITAYRDTVSGLEIAPNNTFDLTRVSVSK